MVFFYFSGTGNSKYIAELFCKKIGCNCFSIEEDIDFSKIIPNSDTIGFCYPVYGSRVPRIMREFASSYIKLFKGKNIIIFCTQLIFSGDGARSFVDLFPKNYVNVIYAEHFFMPNNICNFALLPTSGDKKIKKCMMSSESKMNTVCRNIEKGIVVKRGFNAVSRLAGLLQGALMPSIEKKSKTSVKIDGKCARCGICVSACPMKNLALDNGNIIHKSNCAICYRCVNKCPNKAITVFINGRVGKQYKGIY